MIELSRFNGTSFVVNSDHIETIEATPDTVITLVNGHRYVVSESVGEVISRIAAFRHRCFAGEKFVSQ